MEIINFEYYELREIYDSTKSRVILARDSKNEIKIINMIKDSVLIREYFGMMEEKKEVFVYRSFLCVVENYYEGADILDYLDENPEELMKLSLDICLKLITETLPAPLLYTAADADCLSVSDKGVHINRFYRFMNTSDSVTEEELIIKLQELLSLCFDECPADYASKFSLRLYRKGLTGSFGSLTELYLFVKKHADLYVPSEPKDILRQYIEKTRERLMGLWEKASPVLLIISCFFLIAFLYIHLLKPSENPAELYISEIGGMFLDEKGAIIYD